MTEEQTRINERFNRKFDERVRFESDGAVVLAEHPLEHDKAVRLAKQRIHRLDFSQDKVFKARQRESRAALRNISVPVTLLSGGRDD